MARIWKVGGKPKLSPLVSLDTDREVGPASGTDLIEWGSLAVVTGREDEAEFVGP